MTALLPAAALRGFSKLTRTERFARLLELGLLTPADLEHLQQSTAPALTQLAENFVENVIGCFALPLGVATNFRIDARDYVIPMAVEETSIIAAASRTARWIRECGTIQTEVVGNLIIGQVQFDLVENFVEFKTRIEQQKLALIAAANQAVVPGLVARGGGVHDLEVRAITRDDGKQMAVVHVLLDPCDAMGANSVTQVCEYLKIPLQTLTGARAGLAILSNLNDQKLVRARITLTDIDQAQGQAIAAASRFAELDPYRAATHNKGVLNGIDPVLIATGNDWRAVEAGIHAYAARAGRYTAITTWQMQAQNLVGTFEAPLSVGVVGGVTRLHPTAQLCLRLMRISTSNELARVVAAVGLVQNLGALRALTSEGIMRGHMTLHVKNLLLAAQATEAEQKLLKPELEQHVALHAKIMLTDVQQLLARLRATRATL